MFDDVKQNEIDEIEEAEDEVDEIKDEVLTYSASYSVFEYTNKLNKGVFYKPSFQRNSVWNQRGKSRFIESILMEYPIPQVFLYKEKGREAYLIVDGFQRLSTLNSFIKDEFSLTDVQERFKGKRYSELEGDDQEKFSSRQLMATIVRQVNPDDVQTLYYIFERLNTGGQNLNNMEVRRAINYGELIKSLEEVNKDVYWRKILGKKEVDDRFIDVELILRIFAFVENWNMKKSEMDNYTTSMKPFLNLYCHKNKNERKENLIDLFLKTTETIVNSIGEKPFTLYTRPNYVLLDSVMSSVMLAGGKIRDLKEKFNYLKRDEDFKNIYEAGRGNMAVKRINDRMKIATSIIR